MGHGAFANAWLYIVGPLAGGALAALFFRAQNPEPETGSAIPSGSSGRGAREAGRVHGAAAGGTARRGRELARTHLLRIAARQNDWGGWSRTTDLRINSPALCQLSYAPKGCAS